MIKGWGGFIEGELHWMDVDSGWGGFGTGDSVMVPAIFKTRKIARERYQDVRKIMFNESGWYAVKGKET